LNSCALASIAQGKRVSLAVPPTSDHRAIPPLVVTIFGQGLSRWSRRHSITDGAPPSLLIALATRDSAM
jgi:hypothetical protein